MPLSWHGSTVVDEGLTVILAYPAVKVNNDSTALVQVLDGIANTCVRAAPRLIKLCELANAPPGVQGDERCCHCANPALVCINIECHDRKKNDSATLV
jgi:hypothetical protein